MSNETSVKQELRLDQLAEQVIKEFQTEAATAAGAAEGWNQRAVGVRIFLQRAAAEVEKLNKKEEPKVEEAAPTPEV